jgi:drug/metabolite transporter (DMT)-like permease
VKQRSKRAYTPAGLLAAGTGTIAWGVGIVIIKLTVSPVLIVSFYRHLFSVPILLVAWMFVRDKRIAWRAGAVGGVLFAVHQIAHIGALRYTTAAVVTIFFSMQPILVGAFGRRVTGERTTPRFYAWSVVAIAGCAILVLGASGQGRTTVLGNLLAVANLLIWSAYYLATKKARETVGTTSWLLVMTTVSGAIVGLLALAAGESFVLETGKELTYLAVLAIVPGTTGHFLVTWAQPRIHAAASSAIFVGVPIVAAVGAAIFANEPFGPTEVIGAAIALGATTAAVRYLPPPVTEEAAETYGEVAT